MDMLKILSAQVNYSSSNIFTQNPFSSTTSGTSSKQTDSVSSVAADDSQYLSGKLRQIIKEGQIIFSPAGPWQEYIFRLEDSLIVYLLDAQTDPAERDRLLSKLQSIDIPVINEARVLDQRDMVYPNSLVGLVRVSLRRIGRHRPTDLLRIAVDLCGPASITSNRFKSLDASIKTLPIIFQEFHDISFVPFDDEPYCNVAHRVKYLWKQVQAKPALVGFKLSVCGCSQLQEGAYLPKPESDEPLFVNSSGYSVYRSRVRINPLYRSCRAALVDPPETIFLWQVGNVQLNSVYYVCPTSDPWGVPPTVGWSCAPLGKSPPPSVHIIDANDLPNYLNKEVRGHDQFTPILSESFVVVAVAGTDAGRVLAPPESKRLVTIVDDDCIEPIDLASLWRADASKEVHVDLDFVELTKSAAAALDGIRVNVEESFGSRVILDEVDQKCDDLLEKVEEQLAFLERKRQWLNVADVDALVSGFDEEKAFDRENQAGEVSDDEGGSNMEEFKAKWRLDSVMMKLRSPPPRTSHVPHLDESLPDQFLPESFPALTDAAADLEDSFAADASLELFLSTIDDKTSNSSTQVKLLGAELWPPARFASSKGLLERLNYVIQISSNDVLLGSLPSTVVSRSHSESEMPPGLSSSIPDDSSSKKKRSAFGRVRERLVHRLGFKAAAAKMSVIVLRKDLHSICALGAALEDALKQTDIIPPRLPDAFVISDIEDRVTESMQKLDTNKKQRLGQPFLYSSVAADLRQANVTKADMLVPTLAALNEAMEQLQLYLSSVFACVEDCDDDDELWSLREVLGKILGQFLESTEAVDMADIRRAIQSADDEYVSTESAGSHSGPHSSLAVLSHSWRSFARGGLPLRILYRRSLRKSEDELLRLQKSRCAGCGEPLASSLFGFDKNYRPCRYTGALFCQRWCHSDDRRTLPHKVLLEWDVRPRRVCRQVALFLDHIYSQAILNIDFINPLLFEAVPSLKQVKVFRRSITTIVDKAMSHEKYAATLSEAILSILGSDRLHLGMCSNFFSLQDLVETADGSLMERLYHLYDKLKEILPRKVKAAQAS